MSNLQREQLVDIEDPETRIFRIYSPKWFKKVLNDRRLTLVRPAAWEDPFENALLKCRLRLPDGQIANLEKLRESIYAQCWSLCVESDALWRIYSRKAHGIKVESTVDLLSCALFKRNPSRASNYVIGKVRYKNEQALLSWLGSPQGAQSLLLEQKRRYRYAESLLVKRDTFSHEREVRVVYAEDNSRRANSKPLHQIPVDPNRFFKRVVLDPRLPNKSYKLRERNIRDWGYTGPIEQSQLYGFRTRVIKVARK